MYMSDTLVPFISNRMYFTHCLLSPYFFIIIAFPVLYSKCLSFLHHHYFIPFFSAISIVPHFLTSYRWTVFPLPHFLPDYMFRFTYFRYPIIHVISHFFLCTLRIFFFLKVTLMFSSFCPFIFFYLLLSPFVTPFFYLFLLIHHSSIPHSSSLLRVYFYLPDHYK